MFTPRHILGTAGKCTSDRNCEGVNNVNEMTR